jgi:hypothetical protein
MSKGYTIQSFINLFSGVSNTTLTNVGVETVVSPRFGDLSVRMEALDTWLEGDTHAIVAGSGVYSTFGKTARTRLVKALKNRQKYGTVLV